MDRSSRQKNQKETLSLNNILDQTDLTNTYRTFHPKATEYTFLSSAHGMFSEIPYILDHKTSLNKFKRIEIISVTFSDHNNTKLEINYIKKTGKFTNMWRLFNNVLLNNKCVKEEIQRKTLKYFETNKNGNISKFVGCSKRISKREVHNYKCLPQETRNVSHKQPNFTP